MVIMKTGLQCFMTVGRALIAILFYHAPAKLFYSYFMQNACKTLSPTSSLPLSLSLIGRKSEGVGVILINRELEDIHTTAV
jgi:hypothetical protein